MTSHRLPSGGRIDRSRQLTLYFDGRKIPAHPGDTLASAMLAAGESVVARSFKYHRPRGIYSAGVEEPNALVHLRSGERHEPNTRATMIEAFDGLTATGQNAWPNVRFDLSAANRLLAPFIHAGFYYKTFIGPFRGTGFWMFCERFIRKAAGMGTPTKEFDPDRYEKVNAHCDVLVIGAGPAGLAAALSAGRNGARVMLIEQDRELGGGLLSNSAGGASDPWRAAMIAELEAMANVRILIRATVFGAYDCGVFGIVERLWDHVSQPPELQPRQRYWQVRAKQTVMATGAIERPLVFGGNDKPGVMLAGAARTYLNRYGVLPGRRAVVATNNDSAYRVAIDLAEAGSEVTLTDTRPTPPADLAGEAKAAGATVLAGHGVLSADGRPKVKTARIAPVDANGCATGPARRVVCELIAVSAGWSPALHLWSQRQRKPVFEPSANCFLPIADARPELHIAGAALACPEAKAAARQGHAAGADAAKAAGFDKEAGTMPEPASDPSAAWTESPGTTWMFTDQSGKTKGPAFVDFQHDVGVSDIDQAHREGYTSVEHLKRYTTTGMATDQGKLGNVNALARMAELRGQTIPEVGTTSFRPPFTPVAIGALVGHTAGRHYQPTRLSPIHDWHVEGGAKLTQAGLWMRAWYYPQSGEDLRSAYIREAAHVRSAVGMVDVSTLGKIAVQGPDAAEFLNRIYVNGWKTLAIGRLRYGVMLREDGIVLDDGATARLGANDYFMSTTTANAAKVLAFAEQLLQTSWRDLKVHVTSETDNWAAIAVAGPQARALLTKVVDGCDLSAAALPNNHWTHAMIAGVPLRIHRMSFSGELAYEVYIPSGYGHGIWQYLIEAGTEFDLAPYGTEAMGTLRIEKGHVAAPELDGRTTLGDLGLGGMASTKKPYIGSVTMQREGMVDPARPCLVGLVSEGSEGLKSGSILYALEVEAKGHGEGWISSTTYSPALGKNIALGFLTNGRARHGEAIQAVNFLQDHTDHVTVVSPHFYDPEGERQNG